MKRFSLGLAAAGLTASLSAYAALPTDAAPFQVNIPNLKDGLMFTVEGLYLQPTSSAFDYAATVSGVGTANPTFSTNTVDPGYDFGFRVGIGYVFPQSGNDVQLNWTHLTAKDNDSTAVGYTPGVSFVTPPNDTFFFTVSGNEANTGAASTDIKYDAVDLDVGQYVNFGTRLQVRMFGGLRYGHIKDDFNQSFYNTSTTGIDTYSIDSDSKFDGIGPRFGIDSSYHMGRCFGLVGHVAATALIGTMKASSTLTQAAVAVPAATGSIATSLTAANQTRVVPGVDAKLGLDYSYPFGQNQEYEFRVELGWQATHYVDAVDQIEYNFATSTGDDISGGLVSSVDRETSSIGFQGPYLTLNLKI